MLSLVAVILGVGIVYTRANAQGSWPYTRIDVTTSNYDATKCNGAQENLCTETSTTFKEVSHGGGSLVTTIKLVGADPCTTSISYDRYYSIKSYSNSCNPNAEWPYYVATSHFPRNEMGELTWSEGLFRKEIKRSSKSSLFFSSSDDYYYEVVVAPYVEDLTSYYRGGDIKVMPSSSIKIDGRSLDPKTGAVTFKLSGSQRIDITPQVSGSAIYKYGVLLNGPYKTNEKAPKPSPTGSPAPTGTPTPSPTATPSSGSYQSSYSPTTSYYSASSSLAPILGCPIGFTCTPIKPEMTPTMTPTTTRTPESKLSASCYSNPSQPMVGETVNWQVSRSGGVSPYTYKWSGTDGLAGNSSLARKIYYSKGTKAATVTITTPQQSLTVNCSTVVYPAPEVTVTPTPTTTYTPTYTVTPSPTYTSTPTPTYTQTPTYTSTPTLTATQTPSSTTTGTPVSSADRNTSTLWDGWKRVLGY